jgi:hypothetical protein
MTQSKDLNIQHWSTETVCEWLKGKINFIEGFIKPHLNEINSYNRC